MYFYFVLLRRIFARLMGNEFLSTVVKTTSGFAGPTLLHLIAWEADRRMPTINRVFDQWQAVLAAADLSFKQLEVDIR